MFGVTKYLNCCNFIFLISWNWTPLSSSSSHICFIFFTTSFTAFSLVVVVVVVVAVPFILFCLLLRSYLALSPLACHPISLATPAYLHSTFFLFLPFSRKHPLLPSFNYIWPPEIYNQSTNMKNPFIHLHLLLHRELRIKKRRKRTE